MNALDGDDTVRIIGILMCLTLILGGVARGGWNVQRTALPKLAAMALVWAGLIVLAALAFQHFRPGS